MEVSTEPGLSLANAEARLYDPAHGGVAWFVGRVRNRNDGRDVRAVTYEAHVPLCSKVFRDICEEADARWPDGLRFVLLHCQGRLSIGDISVIAGVSAPHRNAAFEACRYLVEEMKRRAPIWKKEHYTDGDSEWVKGHALCAH
ncbi:MAG: molybdenum cofactor biosynthesis protein MoaE [Gammaproteobacteria bacterium]